MQKTVSVIGGDLRSLTLASLMKSDGYSVLIYGFENRPFIYELEEAKSTNEILSSDIIILPLPVSADTLTVNAPFSKREINLKNLLDNLPESSIVFGGKFSREALGQCLDRGILIYDYMDREELNIANAIPTAEGAIEIALSQTPYTLHKAPCLVIGYGRIGKILSDRLKAFGAKVTVSARKYSDFAMIDALGFDFIDSRKLWKTISKYKIIFNTAPAPVLNGDILREISKDALLIDLASKPGGVDFSLAKELGLNVVWALSLPGKCAPITSGEIIKNTITNILKEMEES